MSVDGIEEIKKRITEEYHNRIVVIRPNVDGTPEINIGSRYTSEKLKEIKEKLTKTVYHVEVVQINVPSEEGPALCIRINPIYPDK